MIKIQNLTFSFKHRPLFRNFSFEVKAGRLARVMGPNGAGKSTLLALMTGLIPEGRDFVTFEGAGDFREWTSWIAADGNGLFPTLSAAENIRFWLQLRGKDIAPGVLAEALDYWGLRGNWVQNSLPVSKFSTGMRRRLALVRLILESSQLWILDEPLFGLDDLACELFRDHLATHISRGGTAIVVTHDDRLLERIPHDVISLVGAVT